MAIKQHITIKKFPDEFGGWYWIRKQGKDWEPVYVYPSERGWPQYIKDVHQTSVYDVNAEWGDEIFPPNATVKNSTL